MDMVTCIISATAPSPLPHHELPSLFFKLGHLALQLDLGAANVVAGRGKLLLPLQEMLFGLAQFAMRQAESGLHAQKFG